MKKVIILLMAMLLLVGCGKEETPDKVEDKNATQQDTTKNETNNTDKSEATNPTKEGFAFAYNGVTVPMNVEASPIVEKLGDPMEYFEAASCAFQGLDKIFYYSGFEISTYPNDGVDYISAVDIVDDSVSTPEGITIGSSLADIKAAYGENYTEESGLYTYVKGETKLTILVENDAAAAITYLAIVEGLNQ